MAAGATYVSIASQTLSSSASSVTFSSISGAYTDLFLVCDLTTTNAGDTYTFLSVNGAPSGTSYSLTRLQGDGATASSSRETSISRINIYSTNSSSRCNFIINFQNYSNTTTYKTILSRCNNTADSVVQTVGLWSNTSAITSIVLTPQSGNYTSGSTFSLYGIAAA